MTIATAPTALTEPAEAAEAAEAAGTMESRILRDALGFAAAAQANRRRKGVAQEPNVNHLIERSFPSAVIEEAHGLFEGVRRLVLVARIRTDSTLAVVALAQRLCLIFHQRFLGIEVDGR